MNKQKRTEIRWRNKETRELKSTEEIKKQKMVQPTEEIEE